MRGRLGDVAGGVGQLGGEDEARDVIGGSGRGDQGAEAADISHATGTGAKPIIARTAEHAAHAIVGIAGAGPAHGLGARIFGRHIHVPSRIVLGDTSPDLLDGGELGGGEDSGIAVGIERRRDEVSACGVIGVPRRTGRRMSGEIQVDDLGGAQARMELKGLIEGIGRRGSVGRGVGTDLAGDRRVLTAEESTAGPIKVQVPVAVAGSLEFSVIHLSERSRTRAVGIVGGVSGPAVLRAGESHEGKETGQE